MKQTMKTVRNYLGISSFGANCREAKRSLRPSRRGLMERMRRGRLSKCTESSRNSAAIWLRGSKIVVLQTAACLPKQAHLLWPTKRDEYWPMAEALNGLKS